MTDWTAGYVADIGYTFGYYQELNPLRLRLAFLNAGLSCPEFGTACELGFGQGVSTNIHAAATVTEWAGTDFNPSQAAFAQELAAVSGNGAKLFDQAFDEFAGRSDLPDFDYIGLHGIWSWISNGNRAVIVDFIRKKLKVGGVLYISYNTQPGWAAMVPMRDLLTEHSEVMGASGQGIVPRIDAALAFADKLFAANPAFARANPAIADRVKKIKEQNRNYVAHEYFNRDWLPMSFADMARWLEPAKLGFACSANYLDFVDAINLTAEQQALLNEIPDVMFRQTVRDFMVNQQFRKDYWVKGARKLSSLEQAEGLRAQKVLLTTHRADVALKVTAGLGEATMTEAVYNPVLDVLADHKPKTIAQVEQAVKDKGVSYGQITQAVMMLIGAGHLASVQDEAAIHKVRKYTDKLNAHLMQKARSSGDISYLASPVTGGGFAVPRFVQLFAMAISHGKKQPPDWAQFAWSILAAQGQKILKAGATLETAEENIAELAEQADAFASKQLPALKALQII
jgi:SAM-dependent methyltransferase